MAMAEVSIRELRNHGGDVVERAIGGERLTITRDGRPVAELRGLPRSPLPVRVLLERWSGLPPVDLSKLRQDLDVLLDPSL